MQSRQIATSWVSSRCISTQRVISLQVGSFIDRYALTFCNDVTQVMGDIKGLCPQQRTLQRTCVPQVSYIVMH